ncbi:hypothetical protein [Fodinibius halophilus]|uniref:Uncharacterized protein n=1 Tax=Fodinibius halophilus TaxID=1736908 RepID=A0A6M1THD0_9BACT|nr:hypothetical protein [Fodinibius halophilus]NGP89512.1 hypothetical protein [Fodinibius halophilus]
MRRKDIIKDFFEERLQNTSQFFLYKDKRLLKNGEYREFAKEQINKANKTFLAAAFGLVMGPFYGIFSLIEYGANPNWFDLAVGLVAWSAFTMVLFFRPKSTIPLKVRCHYSLSCWMKKIKKHLANIIIDSI